jgi:hypothetical protein
MSPESDAEVTNGAARGATAGGITAAWTDRGRRARTRRVLGAGASFIIFWIFLTLD